jgi:hypothetical protein
VIGYDPDNPSNGLIALSNERPLPPLPGETGPPPDEAWKLNIKKDKRIWVRALLPLDGTDYSVGPDL